MSFLYHGNIMTDLGLKELLEILHVENVVSYMLSGRANYVLDENGEDATACENKNCIAIN
ncbi:hypothetical protein MAR_027683 [Mya arenaria]|uniref:Uncharacterized protein n=1 Tax=Mya arenaria TaxID=6604 RepID=A0ABY7EU74_MYAAR|nr:hypothetical protein MAR_027683 [Mya arenaria]